MVAWLCPTAMNATPMIAKETRTVCVLTSDGKLHPFKFVKVEDVTTPAQFIPTFAKTWNLNLLAINRRIRRDL